MIEQLFKRDETVQQHLAAPLAESRFAYLADCAELGASPDTLRRIATAQLAVVRHVALGEAGKASLRQVEDAAEQWASLDPGRRSKNGSEARRRFVAGAVRWLRFANRLQLPEAPVEAHAGRVAEFANHMRQELGWSAATIRLYSGRVDLFFRRLQGGKRATDEVTVADIDRTLAWQGDGGGLSRVTQRSYAHALRAFFRFAAQRGWYGPGLAESIAAPRIYRDERLPSGPCPEEVRRLLETTDGNRPADVRDRPVLLLLTVYGLRAGEVSGLRLDDMDWEAETLRVRHSKTGSVDRYPLARGVGDAIIRYLREARPHCADRAIFLTLNAPIRPLGRTAVSNLVLRRMRRIGVDSRCRGAHSLRHACAQRLLDSGFSMHEIANFLGHRSLDSTAIYAKVRLVGLRTVADFDLEGLA